MTQPATPIEAQPPVLPPDPLEVVIRGGSGRPVAYACPKCGLLFVLQKNEREEERKRREASVHCMKQCVCGKPLDYHYYLRCADCRTRLEAERERQRFEKAQKLTIEEYDDPVYWSGHRGDMGDGYFSGLEALLDYCELEGLDLPEYVWACTRRDLRFDGLDILYSAFERHDIAPETYVDNKATERLQAFLDVWAKEQNIHAWFEDRSRAVLLREGGRSTPPPSG